MDESELGGLDHSLEDWIKVRMDESELGGMDHN